MNAKTQKKYNAYFRKIKHCDIKISLTEVNF